MCNLINEISSIKENYFEKLFLVNVILFLQDEFFKLQSLINSDLMIYILIHTKLVDQICQKLEIQFIWLVKEKLIREYDEKLTKKIIIHKILLNLTVKSHKKLTVLMLIADINHHDIILEKLWMNKNEILLNMQNDVIVFSNQLETFISVFSISVRASYLQWSWSSNSFINSTFKVLQWSTSTALKKNFSMFSVKTASFHALIKWSKKNCIKIFAMLIEDIDRKIVYNTQCKLNILDIAFINASAQNLEDIKVKLSLKYQNFLDVFDQAQVDKLSFHCSYDHKIKLTNDVTSFKCRAYWMSFYKLQKIKEYLNENLSKSFITSSKISYFSLILFILKINDDLCFCIDYQKLNVIIKRNRYSLSLINEMIDKIVNCKHLTQLNIIFTFNKLHMHLNSENYTIFMIALEAYKSKILSFELTNDLILFQQYMNDVLWDFLNDFCQAYLDDILIYNKTQKKHRKHVKMILNHLWDADLQIDIWKCKFNVEETIFLEIIVSEQDLCMNFIKVKAIVNWVTSTNLKEI